MNSTCDKCNQMYEIPEGTEPQCPWCPPEKGKNIPRIPDQIGKYEILEQIGAGGMGVVYKARHTELKNTVALKVMIAGEHASEETLLRFQREARSAAALHHPNIAPVFDVGKEEPLYYIIMEHVEGQNLDQRSQTKITPEEAAKITRDVARALSYAHERNIVHRDVKPGNILVDKEGRAKLVDFGLAKSLLDDKTLTRTGEIIGTASYMPPEQVSGSMREVDEKSDIYSLGTVLYELLSGRTAYAAETLIMTIRQIEEASPTPPSDLNKEVPRELETICFKAMAKEKSRRYATAADLAEDLDRFLKGEPIEARRSSIAYRTTKWIQKRPALSTATAMSLLLIMITVALLFRPVPGPSQEDQDKILFQKALPHLETAQYEIGKASRYTAEARQERRSVLEKAVEELNTAILLYPRYADAFFYRGLARKSLARPDLAQKDFDEAIRLDPTHAEAYYARIQIQLKQAFQRRLRTPIQTSPDAKLLQQKRVEINNDITLLKKLSKRPELALTAEAGLDAVFDNWESALTLAEKALEKNRAFADAYVIRAIIHKTSALLKQKNAKELLHLALEDCNAAIRSEVNNTEAYRVRAGIHLLLDQYPKAIQDLDEMKSIAPDEAQTYIDRAIVLEVDPIPVRSRDQIRSDLDHAIQIETMNPHARFLRASLTIMTPGTEDKFRNARKDLDAALRSDPDFFTALIFRMICHHSLDDETALTRDEEKLETLFPAMAEDPALMKKQIRAYVRVLALRFKIPKAKAIARDAEDLIKLERLPEAKGHYQKVLEELHLASPEEMRRLTPGEKKNLRQVSHYNIACIDSLTGHPKQALQSLRNAFRAGYNDWSHLYADPDLAEVRKLPGFQALVDQFKKRPYNKER